MSQTTSPAFFAAYQSLKLSRDAQGVLLVEFHTKGGPLIFTAQDHTEFVDAFFRIAEDRANKIVIFTGTGGEFIPGIDFSSLSNVADPLFGAKCTTTVFRFSKAKSEHFARKGKVP